MQNRTERTLKLSNWSFGALLFVGAMVLGPIRQLDFFDRMPGDVVDARLNLFFLENIYTYFWGHAGSLIHLSFFYPYPYVSAFSDNLFGAAPIYLLARLCTLTPESAFQFWFILGYFINFCAACYAFRLFGQSRSASAIGAVFFTFGLPASAQIAHAQLQYRFGLALAITYFYLFLTQYDWRAFLLSCLWLVWQFFCSIYLGFFSSLFMASLLIFFLLKKLHKDNFKNIQRISLTLKEFIKRWLVLDQITRLELLVGLGFAAVILMCLFYPYLQVTKLYRLSRTWMEVSAMSPQILSYLLADHSLIWSPLSTKINGFAVRWEQQLFIGIVPLSILVFGAVYTRPWTGRGGSGRLTLLIVALLFLFFLTLNFNEHSLWHFLVGLPLFSAIRALSRIILLFLFPLSLFLAATVDLILENSKKNKKYILALISMLLILEVSAVQAKTSFKDTWRSRTDLELARVPSALPLNPILFFAQRDLSFDQEELDAMRVAQEKDLPTLNGYSGALPNHFRAEYGDDCAEYPRRILLYLEFLGQDKTRASYTQFAQRVAPIGFIGCDDAWRKEPPMSFAREPLSRGVLSQLSLELASFPMRKKDVSEIYPTHLALKIINKSSEKISALTLIDRPLRLAWRVNDQNGLPLTSWTEPQEGLPAGIVSQAYRRDLPRDIPAEGSIEILAPIPQEILTSGKTLEFTLVQEATVWGFSLQNGEALWAQDLGLEPLKVDLSRL